MTAQSIKINKETLLHSKQNKSKKLHKQTGQDNITNHFS